MPRHRRLTADEVLTIRRLAAESILTQSEIAARFGVAQSTVSDVVRRKSWPERCPYCGRALSVRSDRNPATLAG